VPAIIAIAAFNLLAIGGEIEESSENEVPGEQVIAMTLAMITGIASQPTVLESVAFTIFLYGRILGRAAEIDDYLNRGRNMDTRTPASECRFVARHPGGNESTKRDRISMHAPIFTW
jgi:hypothetical protein